MKQVTTIFVGDMKLLLQADVMGETERENATDTADATDAEPTNAAATGNDVETEPTDAADAEPTDAADDDESVAASNEDPFDTHMTDDESVAASNEDPSDTHMTDAADTPVDEETEQNDDDESVAEASLSLIIDELVAEHKEDKEKEVLMRAMQKMVNTIKSENVAWDRSSVSSVEFLDTV